MIESWSGEAEVRDKGAMGWGGGRRTRDQGCRVSGERPRELRTQSWEFLRVGVSQTQGQSLHGVGKMREQKLCL